MTETELKIQAFVKAVKVVDSCVTPRQLDIAWRYVERLQKCKCLSDKMYERLQVKLQELAQTLAFTAYK